MSKHTPMDNILAPIVEKIRERVKNGEIEKRYLAVAEYMTIPHAPFPIPDEELSEFFESFRSDFIEARKKDQTIKSELQLT
jgi:hypothetical protein